MLYYLTQDKNPENETLPPECPWLSFFYDGTSDLPEGAIVVSQEEYDALYGLWREQILIAKDKITMRKRAEVKDSLIGDVGTQNKSRIRQGLWTVADLIALTEDHEFGAIIKDINNLSFELAMQKIVALSNPLVTDEIKNDWLATLQAHLYL